MKVAYNACFGGFGLSNKAIHAVAKRKGINLVWYSRKGYRPTTYIKSETLTGKYSGEITAFTEDIGDVVQEYPKGTYYYPTYDRADKDLIAVIEEMGADANGHCASLAIAEIPDGAEYEITEYDGNESVEPPRQSW